MDIGAGEGTLGKQGGDGGKSSVSGILMDGALGMAKEYVVGQYDTDVRRFKEEGLLYAGKIAVDGGRNAIDGLAVGGAGLVGVLSDLVRLPTEGAYALVTGKGKDYDPFLITKGLTEVVAGEKNEGFSARVVGAGNAAKEFVTSFGSVDAAKQGFDAGRQAVVDFGNDAEEGLLGKVVSNTAYIGGIVYAPEMILGKAAAMPAAANATGKLSAASSETALAAAAPEAAPQGLSLFQRGYNFVTGVAQDGNKARQALTKGAMAYETAQEVMQFGDLAMLMVGALSLVMGVFMGPEGAEKLTKGLAKNFLPESMQGMGDGAVDMLFDASKKKYGSWEKVLGGAGEHLGFSDKETKPASAAFSSFFAAQPG